MNKLKCYKCGGNLIIHEHQNFGVCEECDSLIPLPKFVIKQEQSENNDRIIKRINNAIEYEKQYQFHHAYNQYDKIIKNCDESSLEYLYYYGKLLAQYGVVYRYNNHLENELIVLQTNTINVYENENYQKAYDMLDKDGQIIIKKEVAILDEKLQKVYQSSLNIKPFDILICYDDSVNNPSLRNDQDKLERLIDYCENHHYTYQVTRGLFDEQKIDTLLEKIYPLKQISEMMIVISSDVEHLDSLLFRHIWMGFCRLDELKDTIDQRLMIYTESENLNKLNLKYAYSNQNIFENLSSNLKIVKKINNSLNNIVRLENLLKKRDFKGLRKLLVTEQNKIPKYLFWYNMLLVRFECANLSELMTKPLVLEKEYYYKLFYLNAPRGIKRLVYQYYEENQRKINNSVVSVDYDKILEEEQKARFVKNSGIFVKWSVLYLLFIMVCYMTCSLKNAFSLLSFIVVGSILLAFLIKSFIQLVGQGRKLPSFLKEQDLRQYVDDLKKLIKPDQLAEIIPYSKKREINTISSICLSVLLCFTLFFGIKETTLAIEYSNLEYYYVFDEVFISGGNGKEIIIPQQIGSRDVVKINNRAFADNQKIEVLKINYGLKEIGSYAFGGCINLKEVILPSSLTKIGSFPPFCDCNNMELLLYVKGKIKEVNLLGNDYERKMLKLKIVKTGE